MPKGEVDRMAARLQRPSQEDIEVVFQLILRSDIAEYGEPDTELSDLQHTWNLIDLDQDAWLMKDWGGEIIGYGALVPSRGEIRFEVYIEPEKADRQVMAALLSQCEDRARRIAQEGPVAGHTFLAHVNLRDKEVFLDAGFAYVKSYYQMHIELQDTLKAPVWPEGVQVRIAVVGKDDKEIYQVVQTAFERPEDEQPSYEQWREHMIRPDTYDPALWFLAIAEDRIVGTCLGIKYEMEGWIRQFGVIPTWRGKGIATAMLRHAFGVFRERGYARVGLGMEADNDRAMRLYERVGMQVLRQYDEYQKVYNPA
jgi:mycothiol synthase